MPSAGAAAVLRTAASFGYKAWVIEESCGALHDCRNVLCIPAELVPAGVDSPTLNLAVRSGILRYVDATSIGAAEPNGTARPLPRGWEDYTKFPAVPAEQWQAECAADSGADVV